MSYEDMMDEHAALAHEISNRDLHVEELEKRIEELEAQLAEANEKATQRGARMQIMKEWMQESDWYRLAQEHMLKTPLDWFDEDGVPR